jgi:hypothetical protein
LKTLHLETGERDVEEFDVDFEKEGKEPTLSHDQQQGFVAHVAENGIDIATAIELLKSHGFKKTKDITVNKLEELKKEITLLKKEDVDVNS